MCNSFWKNVGGLVNPIDFEKEIMSNTRQYQGHSWTKLYILLEFPHFLVKYHLELEQITPDQVQIVLKTHFKMKDWKLNLLNFFSVNPVKKTCEQSSKALIKEIQRQNSKRKKFAKSN